MTHARLPSMTMLYVATVGTLILALPLRAQTPPATTDSAVATDTTAKKKSRFGGLVQKAKTVAGNKAVQGAAKGVACTVVPGGAVSAATGTGPCANSGIVGNLMSGNAAGALGAAAGGVTGSAASALAAKGGLAGAAAKGTIGAYGSVIGLSSATAQAAALNIMASRKQNGMSDVAAQAAAMKLMQQNGMSNATAAAALLKMKGAPQANAADAAAALGMIQALGLAANGAGAAPAAGTAALAPASTSAPPAVLWVNYDFVPGERVIYYSDFTDEQVGNFPSRLEFVEGNMEVAELGGKRVVRVTSLGKLSIPLPEVLPQRFTIELDIINRPSLDGAGFQLRGSKGRMDDAKTSVISWGSDGASLMGGGGGEVRLANNEANRARYRGKPAQVRILGDGKYVKVYLDEKRLANVPNANFDRSKILHLVIDARGEENPAFIARIRVAESRKSLYEDLAEKGRVVTHGLLFDSGSDRLRPESAPTLRAIASMIEQHPELSIRIEGHTDNVGGAAANQALSDKRAAAVKAALVGEYRVSGGRLGAKGFGDTQPVGINTSAEGRANNRRVELVKM
jgi:OmpA-OmpF porin, OOP family